MHGAHFPVSPKGFHGLGLFSMSQAEDVSTPEGSDTAPGSRMGSGHLGRESFGNHVDLRDGELSQTLETGLLLSALCLAFPVLLERKCYVCIT